MDVPGLQEYYENLPRLVKSSTIDIKEPVQQKSSCFRSDPFALLPHEMILEVFSHLPIDSVVAFQIASRTANISLSNETWRRRIKRDMPWLWDLFEDHAPRSDVCKTTIDWKKVYAFMECSSRFESCDHICGLVNRRRIWKTCSQIAVLYASKTASQLPPKSRNEDVSENISSKTRCSLIARISKVREPNETRFTTFMLLGLGDLHHGSCVLRTYWNHDERLTGVSMTMKRRSPRLFGHETSIERNVKSIVIEEGDWVQKLTLTLDYCGIKALKVRISVITPSLWFVLFLKCSSAGNNGEIHELFPRQFQIFDEKETTRTARHGLRGAERRNFGNNLSRIIERLLLIDFEARCHLCDRALGDCGERRYVRFSKFPPKIR